MTSLSKNVYIDKLDDVDDRAIKIKPADVKSGTYIDFNKENNKEHAKFEISDQLRISKYKNIFAKGYTTNCFEEVFVITIVRNTVPWTYVIHSSSRKLCVERPDVLIPDILIS